MPNFRALYPEYSDKALVGAVAGLSVPSESERLAKSFGLLVLTQSGDDICLLNEEGFVVGKY